MTIDPKKRIIIPTRLNSLQVDWSIDKLIKDLAKYGVDICFRCSRTGDNEVTIVLQTNTARKSIKKLNELMYELYKIDY